MGRRGPKKTPSAIQNLHGRPSHRPTNLAEPQPAAASTLDPPVYLVDPVAAAEWRRLAPQLATLKLFTDLERNHLAAYCQAFALSLLCQKALAESGTTQLVETKNGSFPAQAPEFNQLMKLWQTMKAHAAELGMTPASRASLSPQDSKAAKGAKLATFLNRG